MGSTNLTPNYELSQFIGTDKPAWLQDYNGDMLKIDTGIAGAKTAADNAQSAADGAQGDATTALSDIANINTELGTVENTLSTATGNINTINSLIGNGTPTTTDQTIIGAINEINANLGGLETVLSGKKAYVSGVQLAEITADGVKTLPTLLSEAFTAAKAYLNALNAGESVLDLMVYTSSFGGFANCDNTVTEYDNSFSGTSFGDFHEISEDTSVPEFYVRTLTVAATSTTLQMSVTGSPLAVGLASIDSFVPTEGDVIRIFGKKFAAI